MRIWRWFCKLGEKGPIPRTIRQPIVIGKIVSEGVSQSGVDMVCSRICGQDGCRCGSTVRGLHCIWSYYRLEK